MTDITPGWAGFSRREDVQDYLVGLGDPPETISGLLTAVEGLGSIKVYVWRETDALWGKHYSLRRAFSSQRNGMYTYRLYTGIDQSLEDQTGQEEA